MTSTTRSTNGRPVVLCILDGWGHRQEREANAVLCADTPVFDRMWAHNPHCLLRTDGMNVGLPEGQFGNSEVGHMNLGAGRVVMQELPRITEAIDSGALAEERSFQEFVHSARTGTGTVHLLGIVSPGGVHGHEDHVLGLARMLAKSGLRCALHAISDGRDTPPRAAATTLAYFADAFGTVAGASIASLSGRYFAMDRDHRWERTSRAYQAIVEARGARYERVIDALERSYRQNVTDEFVEPCVIGDYAGMRDGDSLLCTNFRSDRVRQILSALVIEDFSGFERARRIGFAARGGLVRYSDELAPFLDVLFPPQDLKATLGEILADRGLTQLRMAETEKYPHVTFFFNGGKEVELEGEERILVNSPKVATYDLQPEMSANELTDRFVEALRDKAVDFVLINYANPDMVGHTGDFEAARKAVETVDHCLGRVIEAVGRRGGQMIVTADHGNCELMVDPQTGGPHTAHTLNPVPCCLVGNSRVTSLRQGGRLADIAPTVLDLMGLPKPAEMTGRSLLERPDTSPCG